VFIGEIRDEETAEIAVRAAMTGHLVLSTLHTNNAVSTLGRLLDMKVPGYLLASALNAVVAQRLVRRVCDGCAQDTQVPEGLSGFVRQVGGEAALRAGYRRGTGCPHCNFTGFQGRIGIYEYLEIDRELGVALARADAVEFARIAHARPGFTTLEQAALRCAMQGITTLEEAVRISADLEATVLDGTAAAPGSGDGT